nr:MAG TPA: hypothetical protein [Caudoviricetes sp.]
MVLLYQIIMALSSLFEKKRKNLLTYMALPCIIIAEPRNRQTEPSKLQEVTPMTREEELRLAREEHDREVRAEHRTHVILDRVLPILAILLAAAALVMEMFPPK